MKIEITENPRTIEINETVTMLEFNMMVADILNGSVYDDGESIISVQKYVEQSLVFDSGRNLAQFLIGKTAFIDRIESKMLESISDELMDMLTSNGVKVVSDDD